MRLTDTQAAEVRATRGVYRPADVARAYGVHRSTVVRLWRTQGQLAEVPNIITRARATELAQDIRVLLERGLSVQEVAEKLDVSERTIYRAKGIFT